MSEQASFEGILVAAYTDENAAKAVFDKVEKAKKAKSIHFWDAAVIRKNERGHYFFDETRDMSAPKGAGIGAVIGGLIGVTGGPAGIVIGAGLGAALGGFFANADGGIKDERLEDIGHALESENSALLIVSDQEYLRDMRAYADEEDTMVAVHKLTDGIAEHMQQGQDVAYLITAAGRSVSCHQVDPASEIAQLLEVGQTV
jgi:uncharacterized membrane protein